jgi:hypothetical protein
VPLIKKATGALTRLWTVGESHHDPELPYQPSRLDPATNRPTNTREEVLFKQQESLEHAAQDAGTSSRTNGATTSAARSAGPSAPFAIATGAGVVEGYVERNDGILTVHSGGHTHAVAPASDARVSRDGEAAKLDDIQTGDWVIVTTDDAGAGQQVEVRREGDSEDSHAAARRAWEAAGFVSTLALSGLVKLVRRGAHDAGNDSSQRRAIHNPRKARRPT